MNPYDSLAKTYEKKGIEQIPLINSILNKFILKNISNHAKIIDVGCGAGYFIKQIYACNFLNVHGIDSSENMINYAKNNNSIISNNIIHCDMSTYFNNNSTDIALFIAIVHLIDPTNVCNIFKKIINKIRCRIIITTREYSNDVSGWKFAEKDNSKIFRWKMHYTFDSFNKLINDIFIDSHLIPTIYKITDDKGDPWLICVAENDNAISYLNDGYVKLPASNLFPIDEMKYIYEKAIRYSPNESESYLCFGHPNNITRVERFVPDTVKLKKWINNFDFRPFINNNPTLMKDKMNFKKPQELAFPPHQDVLSGWQGSKTSNNQENYDCLTIGIAIDNAYIENGCFEFVKGEHKNPHGEPKKALSNEWCDKQIWVPIEMKTTEIIVFHGLSPHKTGKNNSDKLRRIVLLTFGNSDYYFGDYYKNFFENKIKNQPPVHMWDQSKQYVEDAFGKWHQQVVNDK
jgi:2-polyprenyl-3-methyl-5-hydroxy-6-metoxy-1,4-benzoquinol methylase